MVTTRVTGTIVWQSWIGGDSNRSIEANRYYQFHVRIDDNQVIFSVDGEFLIEAHFDSRVNGNVVGFAAQNAFTWFDDFRIQLQVSEGAPNSLPFQEDFSSQSAENFLLFNESAWEVTGPVQNPYLQYNHNNEKYDFGMAIVDLDDWYQNSYEISTTITTLDAVSDDQGAFILFDILGPDHFLYAGMLTGENQWVIGNHYEDWSQQQLVVDSGVKGITITPNQTYSVRLLIEQPADDITMWVDDVLIGTAHYSIGNHPTSFINSHPAGVGARNTSVRFDDLQVSLENDPNALSLPYLEDFNESRGEDFSLDAREWSIAGTPSNRHITSRGTTPYGISLASLKVNNPYGDPLEISADISVNEDPSLWKNGFIIFDYKSEQDFKYAGFFAGQNQWVIGHYQQNWSNRLVEIDWDNVGRNIISDQYYQVKVRLNGGNVELLADNEMIATADFHTSVTSNGVGFASDNSRTSFDNFSITNITGNIPSDNLFASWNLESDAILN
ncbi:MAG: hypothetical protein R3C11_13970 [Planctomycetaceae bacterium]